MSTQIRTRLFRQTLGYYILIMIAQVAGQSIVALRYASELGVTTGDLTIEQISILINSHIFETLIWTYAIIAVVLLFKRIRTKRPLIMASGFYSGVTPSKGLWGAVMGGAGCLWFTVFSELYARNHTASQSLIQAGALSQNGASEPLWVEFLAVVILATFFEEVVFRGLIFSRMRILTNTTGAIICQALVYASMYSGGINMGYAVVMGLLMSLAVAQYDTIWAAIYPHLAFNVVSFIIPFFTSNLLASPSLTKVVFALSGVIFVMGGYFFYKDGMSIRIVKTK